MRIHEKYIKYTNAWDSFDSAQGQERETDIEMQQNNLRAGAKKVKV